MALTNTNAQTTAEMNTVPDAVQLMDVFASLQANPAVVTPPPASGPSGAAATAPSPTPTATPATTNTATAGNTTTATTPTTTQNNTWNEPADNYQADQGNDHGTDQGSYEESEDWSAGGYLVDVKSELSVNVQAYNQEGWSESEEWNEGADEAYAAEDESWSEDEASWEEESWDEESWEDDESWTDAETDNETYAEETSYDEASYEEFDVALTVKGSDQIDLSWLGAKFARGNVSTDVSAGMDVSDDSAQAYQADYAVNGPADASYETDDPGTDAYAEGEATDYTEVEIAGDIDLETYAAYA